VTIFHSVDHCIDITAAGWWNSKVY